MILTLPSPTSSQALALTQSAVGLITKEDFSATNGWTIGSGHSIVVSPSYVCSPRTPRTILSGTPGGSNAGGVREASPYRMPDGSVRMYHGAGDGTTASTGNWRPQVAISRDGFLSADLIGDMGAGLYKDPANPGAGSWGANDLGKVYRVGSVWYMQRLTAPGAGSGTNQGVPSGPFTSDVLSSPNGLSNWSLVGQGLTVGSGFESNGAYASCIRPDSSGNLHLYYSASPTGSPMYYVGHTVIASDTAVPYPQPSGSANKIIPDSVVGSPENPEVWTAGGKWYMLTNQVDLGLQKTTQNRLFVASNPLFSDASYVNLQRLCAADGSNAIGMAVPFEIDGRDVYRDANGYMPIAFDTDPLNGTDLSHQGRKIYGAVLEPSPGTLRYVGSAATTAFSFSAVGKPNGALNDGTNWQIWNSGAPAATISGQKISLGTAVGPTSSQMLAAGVPISVGDFTATFSNVTLDNGCSLGLVFGAANVLNNYLIDIAPHNDAASANLAKVVSGAETLLNSGEDAAGTWVGGTTKATVQVVRSGTNVKVFIGSTKVVDWSDSTYGAGFMAVRNGQGNTGQRLFESVSVTTPSQSAEARSTKAVANANVAAEISMTFGPGSGYGAFEFRMDGSGNGYRLLVPASGNLSFQKVTGGAKTNLANSASPSQTTISNFAHRIRVVVTGGTMTAYLDGELQAISSDSTYASGSQIALAAKDVSVDFRNLSLCSSAVLTLTGVTPGAEVVLRAPGDLATTRAIANSSTITLPSNHWPMGSVWIDGKVGTPAGGLIWGGDTYAVNLN